MGYVFVMHFAVLNIATGVTVDGAIQLRNQDRGTRLEQEESKNKALCADLLEMLERMGMPEITEERFAMCVREPEVSFIMDLIGVPTDQPDILFSMLDGNGDGSL